MWYAAFASASNRTEAFQETSFFPGLIIWQGLGLYNTCGDLGRKTGNM